MRKRILRRKNKEKKFVDLHLEKDGETQVYHLETGKLWKMMKGAKKLAGLNSKGWNLVKCTGNDPEKVEMFNKVAQGHKPGAKESLKFVGLKSMPNPVKKFFRKEEGKEAEAQKD